MIGSLGAPELIVIIVAALVVLGPSKMPAFGQSLAQANRAFKKALDENDNGPIADPPARTARHDTAIF